MKRFPVIYPRYLSQGFDQSRLVEPQKFVTLRVENFFRLQVKHARKVQYVLSAI